MPDTTGNPSPPAASASHRHPLKTWTLNFIKIIIAIAGIWLVIHQVRWHDTGILPANGMPLNTITFAEDVPVTILGQKTAPNGKAIVRIAFPNTPIKIRVELPPPEGIVTSNVVIRDGALIPGTREKLPLFHEMDLDLSRLQPQNGERVQEGLQTLIVRASGKWPLLLAAWALLGIPFLVTAIRWRNLMHPQGIHMPLAKCLELTFVGQFYSIILPGVTGGDLVKIVYAARLTGSKTKSFITIILDRVIGLVALMIIAGTSAGIQLFLNTRNPGPVAAGGVPVASDNTLLNVFVLIVVLLAALATGATVYFSHRLRRLVGIEWFVEHFGASPSPPLSPDPPTSPPPPAPLAAPVSPASAALPLDPFTLDYATVRHDKMEHLFRVLNVLALVGAAVFIALLWTLRWGLVLPWALHNQPIIFVALSVLGLIMLVAAAGLILHERLVHRMTPLIAKLVAVLVEVDETLHVYRGHFGLLFWAFAISLLSQLTLPVSAWLSGLAFGMTAPITHYLAYVPVVVLAASLPISPPQGLGVMDGLMRYFFTTRGVARPGQAFALAQAVRFLPMLWNLVGAYWVVTGTYSREKTRADQSALPDPPPAAPPAAATSR